LKTKKFLNFEALRHLSIR